jgi:hypothetical protein
MPLEWAQSPGSGTTIESTSHATGGRGFRSISLVPLALRPVKGPTYVGPPMTQLDEVCAAIVDLQRHRPIMAWEIAHHLNRMPGTHARFTEDEVSKILEALVRSGEYESIRTGDTWTFDDRTWPHERRGYRPTASYARET